MSKHYATHITLDGFNDSDGPAVCDISAYVEVEPSASRGSVASIDGDISITFAGDAHSVSVLEENSPQYRAAHDVLCDLALNDDSSQCVEYGDDE